MNLRETLATRLRDRMDARPDLDTQTKVADKSGIGQSSVQRILARSASATVDSIEQMANAFNVPADLFLLTADEAKLVAAWRNMPDLEKGKILGFIELSRATPAQNARAQLNFTSSKPVPAPLSAAVARASARKPGPEISMEPESHGPARKTSNRERRSAP